MTTVFPCPYCGYLGKDFTPVILRLTERVQAGESEAGQLVVCNGCNKSYYIKATMKIEFGTYKIGEIYK